MQNFNDYFCFCGYASLFLELENCLAEILKKNCDADRLNFALIAILISVRR